MLQRYDNLQACVQGISVSLVRVAIKKRSFGYDRHLRANILLPKATISTLQIRRKQYIEQSFAYCRQTLKETGQMWMIEVQNWKDNLQDGNPDSRFLIPVNINRCSSWTYPILKMRTVRAKDARAAARKRPATARVR